MSDTKASYARSNTLIFLSIFRQVFLRFTRAPKSCVLRPTCKGPLTGHCHRTPRGVKLLRVPAILRATPPYHTVQKRVGVPPSPGSAWLA